MTETYRPNCPNSRTRSAIVSKTTDLICETEEVKKKLKLNKEKKNSPIDRGWRNKNHSFKTICQNRTDLNRIASRPIIYTII